MALVLRKLYNGYFYMTVDIADPEHAGDVLASPLFLVTFIGTYYFIVKKWLPKFMENRQPYNIKNIIIWYNILQILANFYIFVATTRYFWISTSRWTCIPYQAKNDTFLFLQKFFYLLKIADCIETIFFNLKKNFRQVSFLHVYHHCGMVFAGWISWKYDIGPCVSYIGLVNAWVHAIMFVYYLLTTLDPSWKSNLAAKKFLTQMQLAQFVFFIVLYLKMTLDPDCDLPWVVGYLWIIQNTFMFSLFMDFYIRTYWKSKKEKK